jgi:uncharacterized protein (TIGR02246 family)
MGLKVAVCLFLLTVAALPGAARLSGQSGTSRQEAFDQAGVRAAVNKRIEGRVQLNAALSAEPFAEDAVWINAFGRRVVGRRAIETFLRELYVNSGYTQTEKPGPPVIAEVVFVRPEVAVARVSSVTRGQRLADGSVIAERRSHNTMTLTKEADGWKVRYETVTDERDRASR